MVLSFILGFLGKGQGGTRGLDMYGLLLFMKL